MHKDHSPTQKGVYPINGMLNLSGMLMNNKEPPAFAGGL